jgi:hypothetical protein
MAEPATSSSGARMASSSGAHSASSSGARAPIDAPAEVLRRSVLLGPGHPVTVDRSERPVVRDGVEFVRVRGVLGQRGTRFKAWVPRSKLQLLHEAPPP